MENRIEIVEVSPRDGLQSEQEFVSTSDKLALIERAIDAGIRRIEVTSFVNPRRVPQMADAEELVKLLPENENVRYTGLVLNYLGFERARALNIDEIGCAVVATETFNKRNQGAVIKETIKQWYQMAEDAQKRI
jgi:hydroxymethylglutaryl-CoA lyase